MTLSEFHFLDAWSLTLTHAEVLLALVMDTEDSGSEDAAKRATLCVCLEDQLGKLRTLLSEQQEVGEA